METSIELTDSISVKIYKDTEYSINFVTDKKFILEAPKTSTPPQTTFLKLKAKKIEIGFTSTYKIDVFKINGISIKKYISQ
ncbi:MAG: hypothetical protein K6A89_08470 [Treponema sp.]|nr:hypothetical protein [Treponema sp.]